jgi:nucleoside 2-deoxyribosyltransferase
LKVYPETTETVFRADCELMDAAHLAIANMMPFRGVSADAGSAFEIGYLHAQKKPVFGYRSDVLIYLERVLKADSGITSEARIDRQGMHMSRQSVRTPA